MSDWKPGTVAVATVRGKKDRQVVRCHAVGWSGWFVPNYSDDEHGNGWWPDDDEVTDVRPLVVLDIDAPLAYAFALRGLAELGEQDNAGGWAMDARRIADQIEAQTRPPKPDEPTGLGAVVEDADGLRWVRVDSDDYPWFCPESRDYSKFAYLNAVRVLSEGVQP